MKIHSLLRRIKRVNFLLFISGYINAVVYLVFLYIFLYREFVAFEILISVAILVINYFLAIALIWLGYLMWEGKKGWYYYLNIASSGGLLSTLLLFI
ncbi:hypothetical protein ACQPT2_02870 [Erwinia amylovora]